MKLVVGWNGHRPANLETHLRSAGVTLGEQASIVFHPSQPGENVAPRAATEQWRVAVIPGASWDTPEPLLYWLDAHDFDDAIAAERWPTECLASLRRATRHETLRTAFATLEEAMATLSSRTEHALEQLETSVRMATGVQRVLLSRGSSRFPGVALQFKYVPGKGSGGDYYDFLPLEDGKRFVLLLADGRSHGVVASLLSALLRLSLPEVTKIVEPPTVALRHFQEAVVADGDEPESLALSVAVFDRRSLELNIASSSPALLPALHRGGKWALVAPDTNGLVQLRPGDRLCFASGGVRALHPGGLLGLLDEIGDRDPLDTQNETMARVRTLKVLPADLTFLQIAVDEKALFVAKSGTTQG